MWRDDISVPPLSPAVRLCHGGGAAYTSRNRTEQETRGDLFPAFLVYRDVSPLRRRARTGCAAAKQTLSSRLVCRTFVCPSYVRNGSTSTHRGCCTVRNRCRRPSPSFLRVQIVTQQFPVQPAPYRLPATLCPPPCVHSVLSTIPLSPRTLEQTASPPEQSTAPNWSQTSPPTSYSHPRHRHRPPPARDPPYPRVYRTALPPRLPASVRTPGAPSDGRRREGRCGAFRRG